MAIFTKEKLDAIKVVAINFGFTEMSDHKGIYMNDKQIVINTLVRTSVAGYTGLPMIGKYSADEINEDDESPTIEQAREAISVAFKKITKKPRVEHDSKTGRGDAPRVPKPPLGEIKHFHQMEEGDNKCIHCGKPFDEWTSTGEECKRKPEEHDPTYQRVVETLEAATNDIKTDTPESKQESAPQNTERVQHVTQPNNPLETKKVQDISTTGLNPPEPEVKKTIVKNCKICGFALEPKRAAECFGRDPQEPIFICVECEDKQPAPKQPEVMPPNHRISEHKPDGLLPGFKGNMIKGFVPQLAEIGKIKIGRKSETKKTSSGHPLPEKIDHFEIVTVDKDANGNPIRDTVMDSLGKDPKVLNIMLLYNDPTLCFTTRYNAYNGGKCMCSGNGETAIRDGQEVECNPDTCMTFIDKKCKLNGVLSVILLDSPRLGGVYKFRTTSFNSVRSILSSLFLIRSVTGGVLAMIPLKLTLSPKSVQPKNSKTAQTIYVVNIEYNGTTLQLLEKVIEVSKLQGSMRAEIQQLEATARKSLCAPESEEEIRDVECEFYPKGE